MLVTGVGIFCRDDRINLRVARNRKYVLKLILPRPTTQDSGLYMCIASWISTSGSNDNASLTTLLTFHGNVLNFITISLDLLVTISFFFSKYDDNASLAV